MLYKDGRIAVVQSTLDTSVIPKLDDVPWEVSSFPIAAQLLSAPGTLVAASTRTPLADTALTTFADVTGSGYIDICAIQATSAAASTLLLKLTIDGVVLFNYTSASSSTANRAIIVIGDYAGTTQLAGGIPVYFRSSLKIEVQQSAVTGTFVFARYVLAAPYSA